MEHMLKKGIKFNIVSEEDARKFFIENTYFFKLYAYRALYPKCPAGSVRSGEYQNLDFGYLKELSTIDMHLRYLIIEMCLDIEHAIKVKLIDAASHIEGEKGYTLVQRFFNEADSNSVVLKSIRRHKSGQYCKDGSL